MHIFRRIFLSNYWWQKSDIWSQASYRYAISWEAFLDPSDSYFLFADLVGFYTHWTYNVYAHFWRVQKRFSRYSIPIWSLWPNIRFLPSIVTEKNATKNVHICSMCIKINKVGKQEVGIWWVQKRFPRYGIPIWSLWPNIRFLSSIVTEKNATKNILDPACRLCWFLYTFNIHLYMHIFRRIFLSNYWWQESDIWSQALYRYAILWEAFLDPSDSYFLFTSVRLSVRPFVRPRYFSSHFSH
jgi:hypothetical protein